MEDVDVDVIVAEEVKRARNKYGYSQKEFADLAGIGRQTLIRVEKGQVVPHEEVKNKILDALAYLDDHADLEAIFDYIRVQFPVHNNRLVFDEVLKIDEDIFFEEEWHQWGYNRMFRLDAVRVLKSAEEDERGMLIELSGRGCRQMEAILEAQNRTWMSFFETCKRKGGHFTRVDVAINDYQELVSIPELLKKCYRGEVVSRFKKISHRGSLSLETQESEGVTIYFGSWDSTAFFCFYQKDYEQAVKKKIPLEETEIKNRYEVRVKDERAELLIENYCREGDIGTLVLGFIRAQLRFIDPRGSIRKYDCPTNKEWLRLVRDVEILPLKLDPREDFYEKTINWLKSSASRSLQMVQEVDNLNGTDEMSNIFEAMELTDKNYHMIERQAERPVDWII
ncbi:putative DNA relaxase NicK [Tetragenococcus halophilus subsp. flandriensis]|uniref:replication initiation factor domain-containing protein n=1 Tax=Tetragenococcus halophilus TaxID=51669 RepID=UPI0023E95376|nr:replication initiation factor domain-containing protein [Tetragenococcus halophilus]GMA08259.1 putative DNA relaxase NicK [Tetragenococcus halophilus subsp. flandriensis]